MKWQAENDTPKPTIAQFDKAMVHDDTAIEAVEAWEEINPPSARWKRKQFMDWAAFEQRHGVRRAKQIEARKDDDPEAAQGLGQVQRRLGR